MHCNPSAHLIPSYLYKQTFADGYQHEWNILQEQKQQTDQGIDNNVNVENSPGAQVNIYNGQSSNQGQDGGGGKGP